MFRRKSKTTAPAPEPVLPAPTIPTPVEPDSRFTVAVPDPSPALPSQRASGDLSATTKARSRSNPVSKQAVVAPPVAGTFHKPSAYVEASNSAGVDATRPEDSPIKLRLTTSHSGNGSRQSIADLYPSPSTFGSSEPALPNIRRELSIPRSTSLPYVRRANRVAPSFNLVAVGARKTGKTAFLRTFLEAAPTKPSLGGSTPRSSTLEGKTKSMYSTAAEVLSLTGEKHSFTLIDSPGLDIPLGESRVGDELAVERQLSQIIHLIENRFNDTLVAEHNLVRQSQRLHESHVHLALYFIHPESVVSRPCAMHTASMRKPKASLYARSTSTPHLAKKAETPTARRSEEASRVDDMLSEKGGGVKQSEKVSMSPVDVRCITRLSRRVNVLPVLARTDELTIAQLASLKAVIRSDLSEAGLSFATFARPPSTFVSSSLPYTNGYHSEDTEEGHVVPLTEADHSDMLPTNGAEDGGPEPVKVIKIRKARIDPSARVKRRGTSSHRGRRLEASDSYYSTEEEEAVENASDEESNATTLFETGELPLALVAPEPGGLTRSFRWGTLDVINPEHSDFMKLSQALRGEQIDKLKEATRIQKYEPFRTQQLIARKSAGTSIPKSLLRDLSAI